MRYDDNPIEWYEVQLEAAQAAVRHYQEKLANKDRELRLIRELRKVRRKERERMKRQLAEHQITPEMLEELAYA